MTCASWGTAPCATCRKCAMRLSGKMCAVCGTWRSRFWAFPDAGLLPWVLACRRAVRTSSCSRRGSSLSWIRRGFVSRYPESAGCRGFESLIAYYPCRYSGEGAIPLRRQDTHPKPAMTCHATTRDCSRKFPYCSVPESWLAAMLTGTFLTVTQVRSHPAQIHMPMTVDGLYLIV